MRERVAKLPLLRDEVRFHGKNSLFFSSLLSASLSVQIVRGESCLRPQTNPIPEKAPSSLLAALPPQYALVFFNPRRG